MFIRVKDRGDWTETFQGQTRSDRVDQACICAMSLHMHVSLNDIHDTYSCCTHTFIMLESNSLARVRHTGH